ncbi:hypothetical protein ACN47E_001434 [Coniothyrium glycines]
MDTHQLINHIGISRLSTGTWLNDPIKVERVKSLRELAFGNCRLLYGSERGKFFDIVIAEDVENNAFCAILVCSQEGASKILRKEVDDDPLKAVQSMVNHLQKDTACLFHKFDVGSQLKGQQGYFNKETAKFELTDSARDERIEGPDDDTHGLTSLFSNSGNVPRGPRTDRGRYKRVRGDYYSGRVHIVSTQSSEGLMGDGRLAPLDYGDLEL